MKNWLLKLLALFVAAMLWLSCIHLFYKPKLTDYLDPQQISPKARLLAATHLRLWTDPTLRQQELEKMSARNPEWAFMSRTYFVLALANMALREPTFTDQACEIIDVILTHTLQLEQEHGFTHFLLGYANSGQWQAQPPRSIFVDGEVALMLAARRMLKEHLPYQPLLTGRVRIMIEAMRQSPVLCAESYPDECWMFCNTVALAAIRLADGLDGSNHQEFIASWLATAKQHLIEPTTGLLISTFDMQGTPSPAGFGPEGTTIWMVCNMLQVVDPVFAEDQYHRARKELGGSVLGFGYSREWPVSVPGTVDIDSGPIVPWIGASASASGLAILAAAAFKDTPYFSQLITALNFAGFPVETAETLRYAASNPVGDAVLLYALVQGPLWQSVQTRRTP